MSTPVGADPNNARAIVNEAQDGEKVVPIEVFTKASDDSTFNAVTDVNGLPVKLVGQKLVTIANAVAILDTAQKFYNLITHGGMSEEQIRQYKRFKVSLNNTHDQAAAVSLYTASRSYSLTGATGGGLLYTEAAILTATTGRLTLQDKAGGTGASTSIKTIPALGGVHSNIIIGIQFATAPTTGSLTIMVEMQ